MAFLPGPRPAASTSSGTSAADAGRRPKVEEPPVQLEDLRTHELRLHGHEVGRSLR